MATFIYIIVFASGVILDRLLVWKFSKPTTINEFKGTVKNKQRGRNNEQINDNTTRIEITAEMSRRDVIKTWKELKKNTNLK